MTGRRAFEFTTCDSLLVEVTTDPDDPILQRFFEGYDRAFVLPDEKESYQGLQDCLALNSSQVGERLTQRYGPHSEVAANIYDTLNNDAIGGFNLLCYPIHTHEGNTKVTLVCGNLNYVFVNLPYREHGYLRKIIPTILKCMDRLLNLKRKSPVFHLLFAELNDPFRLTAQEYVKDTEHAGIDQLNRILIWAKLHFKIIDFPYVQPSLSSSQAPDAAFLYSVLASGQFGSLSSQLLREHLERFFAISVLKGAEPHDDPTVAGQLKLLDNMAASEARIRLIDPTKWLATAAPTRMIPGGIKNST